MTQPDGDDFSHYAPAPGAGPAAIAGTLAEAEGSAGRAVNRDVAEAPTPWDLPTEAPAQGTAEGEGENAARAGASGGDFGASYQAHLLDEPDGPDNIDAFKDFVARAGPQMEPPAPRQVEHIAVGDDPRKACESLPPAVAPAVRVARAIRPAAPVNKSSIGTAATEFGRLKVAHDSVSGAGVSADDDIPTTDRSQSIEDGCNDEPPDQITDDAVDAPPLVLGYAGGPSSDNDLPTGGGGWTIPLLCAGIGIVACCLLIPLSDTNRRMAYERQRLRADLASLQAQVATNDEFLRKVHDDPSLAERLAQRQMKTIREGTAVLRFDQPQDAGGGADRRPDDMSPFQIVAVAPPTAMPIYQPLGGTIANLCYRPRSRLYLMGAGLMLMAVGLVLGLERR